MSEKQVLAKDLDELLSSRDFDVNLLDSKTGKSPVDPKTGEPDVGLANIFRFNWRASTGKEYGTVTIMLGSDNTLEVFSGDNLGKTMDTEDKDEWFGFLYQLKQFAVRNFRTFRSNSINRLRYSLRGQAAITESLFESYYGNRTTSYTGAATEARLMIRHNRTIGENDARFRYIESLFIETSDGERYRLPFKKLSGGRAMLEHIKKGGRPYDMRGQHIVNMVEELNVLAKFNRANQGKIFEGESQQLVTETVAYYENLQRTMKGLSNSRGYQKYFESWKPLEITEENLFVDDIKKMFTEQIIDTRIEQALPLLARIQQRGKEMKEADIFENWINRLAEGTWNLPETPEQLVKLKTLMTKELIVGPDATNATEQLYDLVGDDKLFDRLHELADQDPRANVFNDTEVMNRLRELGIELPEPTAPGNPAEPQTGATAPVVPTPAPTPAPQQPVAEEINQIRRAAVLPVAESVLTDSTGHTMDHILKRFSKEVANFKENGDPYEYVSDRLADDLGMNEVYKEDDSPVDVAPWYKNKAEQDADKAKSVFKKKHNPNRTGKDSAKALAQKGIPKTEAFDFENILSERVTTEAGTAASQYASLADAYPEGSTEVWYWNDEAGRDMMMGANWLQKKGQMPTPETLEQTHVKIGTLRETNPDKVFGMMQGENWSPQGEARDLISKSNTGHTSMSVGDIVKVGSTYLMVDRFGFHDISKQPLARLKKLSGIT